MCLILLEQSKGIGIPVLFILQNPEQIMDTSLVEYKCGLACVYVCRSPGGKP